MTPDALAKLHAAAFLMDRSWSASEFQDLLDSPFVVLCTAPHGFALTRTIAGESELLTLAVGPAHQRQGIAAGLMHDWLASIAGTADTAFLEVAADNTAARALYMQFGFSQIATRAGYYARKNGPAVDALIFRQALTKG